MRFPTLPAAAVAAASAALLLAGPSSAVATTTTTNPRPVVGGERLAAKTVVTDLPDGVPAPPKFSAGGWVLADLDTGEVIAARNAHGRYLPASTLKTLTVLTTMPQLDPGALVQAANEDLVEGTQVGLDPHSKYTVQQLLLGTMLSSGNDTATALARVAGGAGGVRATVAAMQANAQRLGAFDTVVHNPSGLDAPGQLSSAYDLALVARAAMALPQLRALVATKHAQFPGKQLPGKKRKSYQISNHNTFLFNYDGATGVKNGYTVAARWTAIAAATRGGHTYVLTALRRGESSWRPQAALFDWAFRYGGLARPVGSLVTPEQAAELQAAAPATASPAPVAAAGSAVALARSSAGDRSTLVLVATAAGIAVLLVGSLLGLSARARRRQLHAARVARSARQPVR
ncbi:D-alanyl-D-alanine carboxypeptidase family protein [Angustibacter sp. McL0619]|uniref:D-alanyl-D-alanine carboxypeptidase family protein n=1 Tax=Angustibacter sp. McL0619 TaxID=3415676 RepID=UPI003CF35CB0